MRLVALSPLQARRKSSSTSTSTFLKCKLCLALIVLLVHASTAIAATTIPSATSRPSLDLAHPSVPFVTTAAPSPTLPPRRRDEIDNRGANQKKHDEHERGGQDDLEVAFIDNPISWYNSLRQRREETEGLVLSSRAQAEEEDKEKEKEDALDLNSKDSKRATLPSGSGNHQHEKQQNLATSTATTGKGYHHPGSAEPTVRHNRRTDEGHVTDHGDSKASLKQGQHQRRRPMPMPHPRPLPAQFWAGWPKETLTVLQTITQTLPADGVAPPFIPSVPTTTNTAEVTTTIYDSNLPASGTLTVIGGTTTVLLPGGAGGGAAPTASTTTTTFTSTSMPTATASGTSTLTRTATIESRLPQTTQQWTPADIPRFSECLPGDEDYEEDGVLSLTREQRPTLIALGVMFVVILIGWNLLLVRTLLYPLKSLVVLVHEAGHVIIGTACGYRIEVFKIDPTYGGRTTWEIDPNFPFPLLWPTAALPFGYLLNAFVGATFILCGFNTLASKIASIFIILMLIVVASQLRDALGLGLVAATIGLIIGFWFIEHAMYLRYFVLFVGVMCCWYVIWDFIDDYIFSKMHACCAVIHSQLIGGMAPFIWLYIYLAITSLVFVGFLLIAIYVFRQSPHSMFCQGQSFLPT